MQNSPLLPQDPSLVSPLANSRPDPAELARYLGQVIINSAQIPDQYAAVVVANISGSPRPKNLRHYFRQPAFAIITLTLVCSLVGAGAWAYTAGHHKPNTLLTTSSASSHSTASPQSTQKSATPKQSAATKKSSSTQPAKTVPSQSNSGSLTTTPPTHHSSTPSQPVITVPVYNNYGANFYYAGASQYVTANGASVQIMQAKPKVPQPANQENHSLVELAIQSSDGQQIVEIGWIVDPIAYGDTKPHLFVYHWVDRQTSCYDGCGFVPAAGTMLAGKAVTVGSVGTYQIKFVSNKWVLSYNGKEVGYYPESLWNGKFKEAGLIQTFGEVELMHESSTQCIQMGNGLAGTNSDAATISHFTLFGASRAAALTPYQTAHASYSYGAATSTSLRIGGPGNC